MAASWLTTSSAGWAARNSRQLSRSRWSSRFDRRARAHKLRSAGAVVAGQKVGATVSIGAATATEVVTNIDALIARADVALYRAKGEGRNRLRTADGEPRAERAPPDRGRTRRTM